MRPLLLALLLSLAASGGALAYCPLYPAGTAGGEIAAQADKAVCQQQELNFQSQLNDTLRNLEQDQRMQQMFVQQQLLLTPAFPVR